uniref:Synaptonemal complex central element protein 3 n=1 Tax=Chelydra serpentina TaxID=8475 RepID=A0A8C3SDY2_CHESE
CRFFCQQKKSLSTLLNLLHCRNTQPRIRTVQATWMAYDMVVMRTNPDLANSMRRLEDAFLNCKEEMEKNWQEMLKETKGTEQKQE